ncbi:CLUMA_CG002251, isoform A [Clunio marinus]|uniref:CLUMA_CG002251, isoform A n=1 Tax=Clunio marinus TaxID=568069 RepID=A0A1J1HQP3_9DIPT|nr:CLUMA_CG002251, isoform A [Clunio marinus]
MDPMRIVVSSYIKDINRYLEIISDYGLPNYKYFNYVLNRMGISYIYVSKYEIFNKQKNVVIQFVESTLVALKKKFISETSPVSRAGIIFLLSKIFFTDDIANLLKLRITSEEWEEFKNYINTIKHLPDYEKTRIIFYQLFLENFFKFTMKNKALALDFGNADEKKDPQEFYEKEDLLWNDIKDEISTIQHTDVVELNQLMKLREECIKPFEEKFPEKNTIEEVLNDFETIKSSVNTQIIDKSSTSKQLKRGEIIRQCRSFLNASSGPSSIIGEFEVDEIYFDSEEDSPTVSKKRKRMKKNFKQSKNKKETIKIEENSSSDSDSDGSAKDFKHMNRSLGYHSQNVMKGIGATINLDKLRSCYDDTNETNTK